MMTRTKWFIVGFWIVVLALCARSFYMYDTKMSSEPVPEQHWFPPALPTDKPVQSENADVRMTRYIVNAHPGDSTFTADIVVQNLGKRKATNIQVRLVPYHALDVNTSQPGPDEIENPGNDSMATTYQWVEFPDLAPGETEIKTLSFIMRSDAEPRTRFDPKITFDSAKDNP